MKSEALPLPSRLKPALPALGVASLLAAGTNAYGQIVFTDLGSGTVVNHSTATFNIDGTGVAIDLSLSAGGGEGGYLKLAHGPYTGAAVGAGGFVSKLTGGTTIGSGSTFDSTSNSFIWASYTSSNWGAGSDSSPSRAYVGFRFHLNSGSTVYYGWLDLEINPHGGGTPPSMTVFGYAYQATGGASIQAGATAIPEPSVTALVIGAASLLALRQRRRQAA